MFFGPWVTLPRLLKRRSLNTSKMAIVPFCMSYPRPTWKCPLWLNARYGKYRFSSCGCSMIGAGLPSPRWLRWTARNFWVFQWPTLWTM
jgi:hypothetical protein